MYNVASSVPLFYINWSTESRTVVFFQGRLGSWMIRSYLPSAPRRFNDQNLGLGRPHISVPFCFKDCGTLTFTA